MDMGVSYHDILAVLKKLPPARVAEVYDFARFLQSQHSAAEKTAPSDDRSAFLATFGAWKDERSDEEIIAEIYGDRTTSMDERTGF